MYLKYFFNTKTGEVKLVGSPKKALELEEHWVEISGDEYDRILLAVQYYKDYFQSRV